MRFILATVVAHFPASTRLAIVSPAINLLIVPLVAPAMAAALIALLGGAFTLSLTGFALAGLHIVAGTVWAIFHILIITLQAFVFMMLTLVYVGQAHETH